jgi:hypothetical protein
MSSIYSKAERYKDILRYMFEKYQPKCWFCKETLDWRSFYRKMSGKSKDEFTEHHINLKHFDNNIENRELAHRTCHRKYHTCSGYRKMIDERTII